MNEWDIREALCEIGRRAWQRGWIAANDGNFSHRLDEDRILATPTQISKGFMKPDDLVVVSLSSGKQVAGWRTMTSEVKAHLHIYRHRADVQSVVHLHPPHATAFCIARLNLPKCVLPEVELFLGQIPLAPYATPGTQDFAEALTPYLAEHWAFLLTNHGALTLGKDPFHAYYNMEIVEQYCRILILAGHIGDWNRLDFGAMKDIFGIKDRLGLADPRPRERYDEVCQPGVAPLEFPLVSDDPKLAHDPAPGTPGAAGAGKPSSGPPVTAELVAGIVRDVLRRRGLL